MFSWFKKQPAPAPVAAPEPVPVVVPEWAEPKVPVQRYSKYEYSAYHELIPTTDDMYIVRFYKRPTGEILEEHTIISEPIAQKLVVERMEKWRK